MTPQVDGVPEHGWLGAPIDARPLFAPEHATLIGTLRALAPADWEREAVPGWTVRDLAVQALPAPRPPATPPWPRRPAGSSRSSTDRDVAYA